MSTTDNITVVTDAADTLAARLAKVRRCPRCSETKPIEAFGISRSNASGHGSHCLACSRDRMAEFRSTPEGKAANIAAWRKSRAKARARA